MATVVDETVLMEDEDHEQYDTIGMLGGSGHGLCDRCAFNTANWAAFISSYYVGNIGPVLNSIFRVDAGTILGYTIVLRLVSMLMGPCLGCFHDGEILQPCFEKMGCPRKKCGRRAPHLFYLVPISFVAVFCSWRMPIMATMVTTPDSTAKLHNVVWGENAVYATKTQHNEKWSIPQPFKSAASYADVKNGMPCGTMLQLTTSTGISFTFNDTSRTVAGYGQDVCTHLMGLKAVCWPGPANAPVTGDGAPRVCSNMEQERKNFFFFFYFNYLSDLVLVLHCGTLFWIVF